MVILGVWGFFKLKKNQKQENSNNIFKKSNSYVHTIDDDLLFNPLSIGNH
jgi:hypothetical protein